MGLSPPSMASQAGHAMSSPVNGNIDVTGAAVLLTLDEQGTVTMIGKDGDSRHTRSRSYLERYVVFRRRMTKMWIYG